MTNTGMVSFVYYYRYFRFFSDGSVISAVFTQKQKLETIADIMTKNPKVINKSALAISAFNLMEDNKITQLVVVQDGKYLGIVHMHDILREGIV